MADLKPVWKHDCNECKLIGREERNGEVVDLYVHEHEDHITLVARRSDEGSDYLSKGVYLKYKDTRLGVLDYCLLRYIEHLREELVQRDDQLDKADKLLQKELSK